MNSIETLQALTLHYGDPMDHNSLLKFAYAHVELWEVQKEFAWFPAKHFYVHKGFKPFLQKFFSQLEKEGLHTEIKTCDGCFNVRYQRGYEAQKILSIHSWACAIDLNAATNPLGGKVTWSARFLQIARECGLTCGADFGGIRVDGMHFEVTDIALLEPKIAA